MAGKKKEEMKILVSPIYGGSKELPVLPLRTLKEVVRS
jgi:hypothetical protein